MDGGRLTTVVVRRAVLDGAEHPDKAYDLVYAIVDYVNDMMREGVYHPCELQPEAMQVYHADYYRGQVENGGHSQFIYNAGVNFPAMSADALAGLEAMGLSEQHRILSEMIAWANANPEEAAAQNGFSTCATVLDELDTRFCAADDQTPMIQRSAEWITTWPNLRLVEDDRYAAEIQALAQLNPHLAARKIWQSVQALLYQMTDRLQLTVAVACGAVTPDPEIKLAVTGGSHIEIEGQMSLAFSVDTDKGDRLCVSEDTGGRLYEFIKSPPLSATAEQRKAHRPMGAGARLSAVSETTVRSFYEMAERTLACEAIDLLLRKAPLAPGSAVTAWKLQDTSAVWIVVSGQNHVVATTSPDRATLTQRDGTPLATVTRAEIERHAAQAAAGGAPMQQSG